MPVVITAVLVLVDVVRMRSTRLYEVNAEAKILEDLRGLVKTWVDSGGYTYTPEPVAGASTTGDGTEGAPPTGTGAGAGGAAGVAIPLKFDEMNGAERCRASVAFAKTQLKTALSVRLMFRM